MNVYLILGSARKIQLNKQKFVYTKFHGKFQREKVFKSFI